MEREIFPFLLNNHEKVSGYHEEANWADVGTISDFKRFDKELLSKFYTETSKARQ